MGVILCDCIDPVNVGVEFRVVACAVFVDEVARVAFLAGVLDADVVQQCEVVGSSEELGQFFGACERVLDRNVDGCFSGFTLLGCDEDHAIGTAHTIDGACRCVFKH